MEEEHQELDKSLLTLREASIPALTPQHPSDTPAGAGSSCSASLSLTVREQRVLPDEGPATRDQTVCSQGSAKAVL